jgi:hypothetical protein
MIGFAKAGPSRAWFIGRVRDEEEEEQAGTQDDLADIATRLEILAARFKPCARSGTTTSCSATRCSSSG